MMRVILCIFVIGLCGLSTGELIYPTTVHQKGETQTVHHQSQNHPSQTERKDQEDNVPAQSYQVNTIETAPYDPTAVTTNALTPDAIQQYITQNSQHGIYHPTYYPSGYDTSVPGAYSVATGYEGYLVPSESSEGEISGFSTFDLLRMAMPTTTSMARTMFNMMRRVVYIVVYGLGYIAAGGGITALFCAVTPFCRLTFLGLPFLRSARETATSVTKVLANEVTEERVKRAADLLMTALQKYQQMEEIEAKEAKEAKEVQQKIPKKTKNQ